MTESNLTKARQAETTAEPTSEAPIYQPRFDIFETDSELTLYGDMPGVEENQLDIRYENEQLMIHGKVPQRHENIKLARQEYGVGNYHRSFVIGESIDPKKISAEIDNGVLVIHLPKVEAAKPRRIAVKASN
tara:strand:- start:161348 stop:161743 length:396 start_codon:yes stop_codon:yes gene_type:complete